MDFKEFLHQNRLRQVDVARYLGVTEASISRLAKGLSEPSSSNLGKLLNNPYGWDTSMLNDGDMTVNVTQSGDGSNRSHVSIGAQDNSDALKKEIELLRGMLEEEKARSAQYWDLIQKLTK